MFIGTGRIIFHLPGSFSLKDKRRVVKSIKDKLKAHHNISIAETDYLDSWQKAEICIACVANAKPRIDQILNVVVEWMRQDPRIVILSVETEVF